MIGGLRSTRNNSTIATRKIASKNGATTTQLATRAIAYGQPRAVKESVSWWATKGYRIPVQIAHSARWYAAITTTKIHFDWERGRNQRQSNFWLRFAGTAASCENSVPHSEHVNVGCASSASVKAHPV